MAETMQVYHSSLKQHSTDSAYKAVCPACKAGLLLVKRDKKSLFLLRDDMCVSCGQSFQYLDDMINGEAFNDVEIMGLKPMISDALWKVAKLTELNCQTGRSLGGVINLYEYCTFTVHGFEPVVLGATFRWNQGALYFDLDLVGEDSGNIYWKTDSVQVPWNGPELRSLVEQALLKLPDPSVIRAVFGLS